MIHVDDWIEEEEEDDDAGRCSLFDLPDNCRRWFRVYLRSRSNNHPATNVKVNYCF